MTKRIRAVSSIAPLVLLATCASAPAADLTAPGQPFEDRVGDMMAQVEFDLQLAELVVLLPYLEADSPAVDAFDVAFDDIGSAAGAIVSYSVGVVDLLEQGSDSAAVEPFVGSLRDLVETLRGLPSVLPHLAGVDAESALDEAARQKSLRKALRAAAPVTNKIAFALRATVIDANDRFDLALEETSNKILTENRPLMNYIDALVAQRNDVLEGLILLDRAGGNDQEAWRELLETNPDVAEALSGNESATAASLKQAETVLVERLAKISEIWSHLKISFDEYQVVMKELYAAENDIRRILKLAQLIAEEWDSAQSQLAKGKPNAFAAIGSGLFQLAYKQAVRR